MDAATRDLLQTVYDVLKDMSDWRAVGVRSALGGVLKGDDPGREADWLRDLAAEQRREAMRSERR